MSPNLRIAGTFCPPVGFEHDPAWMRRIREDIVSSQPDVVFVALGSPKQEYLIQLLRTELPKAWWVGVGISFSFVCGDVKRSPMWMRRLGLEWLHRLAQEPRRLMRRYLLDGMPFAFELMVRSFLGR